MRGGDLEDILRQIQGDGNFDDVAIRTFKVGLPAEHGLGKSLTRKLAISVCQLME